MYLTKMIKLLTATEPTAILHTHCMSREYISGIIVKNRYLELISTSDIKDSFTALDLLKILNTMSTLSDDKINDSTQIKLDGLNVLFVCKYLTQADINMNADGTIVIETSDDMDMTSELYERFKDAANNQQDELDFFMELMENGIALQDIKKFLPEKYKYSKKFMQEHGLI